MTRERTCGKCERWLRLALRSCAIAGLALSCAFTLWPARALAAGEIYWFGLLSEDVFGAIRFYSGLFGWEIVSGPAGGYMALRDAQPFASLNEIEDRLPGMPESLWLAAIGVDDVAASVRAARAMGATIHQDATEVRGWGVYALIEDPQGAPLLLVDPARPLGGTQGFGGWRWAELWTHDTGAAADFYRRVIGYEVEAVRIDGQTYDVLEGSSGRDAGLVQLDRPEIAARWMPYVGVNDLRAILVRVWEEGGRVLREPSEVSNPAAGANRIALIADPSGAAVFLYQLEEQAAPDPVTAAQARQNAGAGRRQEDGDPSLFAGINVSYGFGPGWGSAYPGYPYGPFGPRY